MSLLNLLNLGAGLLGASRQNAMAEREMREARRMQDAQMRRQEEDLARRQGLYDSRLAAGVYDPSARLETLRESVGEADRLARSNASGAMRVAGYRPGDAAHSRADRRLSETARLRQALMEEDVRAQARREQSADLAATSPRNMDSAYWLGENRFRSGWGTQVDPSGLVSAFLYSGGAGDLERIFRRPKRTQPLNLRDGDPMLGGF